MLKRYYGAVLAIVFVLLDYLALIAAEQSAFMLRNFILRSSNLYISWLNFWIVFPSLFLLFIHLGQLYRRRMPFYKEVEKLFYACCYGTLAVIFVLYVARIAATTSRMFVGLFGIVAFALLAICRYAIKRFLLYKQLLQVPTIIIGAGKTAELLVKGIVSDAGLGYKIVGLLEDNKVQPGILEKYPVLGCFADAERVIK